MGFCLYFASKVYEWGPTKSFDLGGGFKLAFLFDFVVCVCRVVLYEAERRKRKFIGRTNGTVPLL